MRNEVRIFWECKDIVWPSILLYLVRYMTILGHFPFTYAAFESAVSDTHFPGSERNLADIAPVVVSETNGLWVSIVPALASVIELSSNGRVLFALYLINIGT